jgi:LysM repeat protein
LPLVFGRGFGKHRRMVRSRWLLPGLLLATCAGAQPAVTPIDIANLREDVRGLSQRLGDLTLRVEQLEAENSQLKEKARSAGESGVTLVQLNQAIADLNRTLESSVASSKEDTLRQVSIQIEKLARQVNAALEGLSRNGGPRPAAGSAFSENFPKEGVTYAVQRGDTVASIAKKTGAKVQDIINANKLADPAHIRAGQTLFIPGGK